MDDQWKISKYDPEWTKLFSDLKDSYSCKESGQFFRTNDERPKYVEGKGPIVWEIMQKAHMWSQEVGWEPSISDM